MNLFKAIDGGQRWLSHHGHPFFVLSNRETTTTYPSNLTYDDDVVGEFEGDDGDDVKGDDEEEASRCMRDRRRATSDPSAALCNAFDAVIFGAVGLSMFQTILDRLN